MVLCGVRALFACAGALLVAGGAVAGCSLLFHGEALLPVDAAVPLEDMARRREPDLSVPLDLAPPPDLTPPRDFVPPRDLMPPADLTPPCSGPFVFDGFGDGGIDCRCQCTLDPFTAMPDTARWTIQGGTGWSVTASGGVLTLTKTGASNNDSIAFLGNWKLPGDFDLRVDFTIVNAPVGGRAQLIALGPAADMGGRNPTLYGIAYTASGGPRVDVTSGDDTHDVGGAPLSGTLRIARTGATTCVELVGFESNCRPNAALPVQTYFLSGEFNGSCAFCGDVTVQFSNARLVTGLMVPP
jgi:hypothetical protein